MPKSQLLPAAATDELTYEAALAQLEALVARMDSGQMPLDELLSAYKHGAVLLKICRDKLTAVDQQIRVFDDIHKPE